jgi:hypothetical protein
MRRARTWLLWGGAALILAVNAVLLAGVVWNRSGEPGSSLTLGQRELTLPYAFGLDGERGGVTLMLNWRVLPAEGGTDDPYAGHASSHGPGGVGAGWLDEAKLRALGFDLPRDGARRPRAREVYLVLELAGEAWQQAQDRARGRLQRAQARGSADERDAAALKSAQEALQFELHRASRLFAVDAGLDAAALRQRHPDLRRYAIVRARVTAHTNLMDRREVWQGVISELAVSSVSVPYALRSAMDRMDLEGWRTARAAFEIDLSWGRRFEPWISALRAQPGSGS